MSYNVKIVRENLSALFDLKGEKSEMREYLQNFYGPIPLTPNTCNSNGAWKLMYVGPKHWILKAPIDDEEKLVSLLRPDNAPKSLSIVLISDTLTFFSLSEKTHLILCLLPLQWILIRVFLGMIMQLLVKFFFESFDIA